MTELCHCGGLGGVRVLAVWRHLGVVVARAQKGKQRERFARAWGQQLDTLRRDVVRRAQCVENGCGWPWSAEKVGAGLGHLTIQGRSESGFAENIIGHASTVSWLGVQAWKCIRGVRRAFALLHQPARHDRRGVFVEPLIDQGTDLLAEIGSVIQAGQFVTLQAIARSSEQKFPWGLGPGLIHGDPPAGTGGTERHPNTVVQYVKSYYWIAACGKLWKTFRGSAVGTTSSRPTLNPVFAAHSTTTGIPPTCACSNCSGDYEDPDRTAAPDEFPEEWEGGGLDDTADSDAGARPREPRDAAPDLASKANAGTETAGECGENISRSEQGSAGREEER